MTVEKKIYDAVKGLAANRVFPDVAPVGTARPFITYQQVGGEAVSFLGREISSKKNGRFQLNVWSDSRSATAALALQVEAAIVTSTEFQSDAVGSLISQYEEDTKLYGTIQHFSIWSDR